MRLIPFGPFILAFAASIVAAETRRAGTICPPDPADSLGRSRAGCDRDDPRESPNAFVDEHLFELVYPASPADPGPRSIIASRRASAAVVRRDAVGAVAAWQFLGPAGVSAGPGSSPFLPRNFSGRATSLAIAPHCSADSCRLWLGTAGGGVWKTDRALDAEGTISWRHVASGLAGNTIGALALDPSDASGNTLYAGTGEANFNFTSGAGTGVYRSTDGGESWHRLDTRVVDPAVSSSPIDFTASRGISRVVVDPGRSATLYVATAYALAGMTAVRGGQSVLTGRPEASVGLYRSENGGGSWTLLWAAPIADEPPTPGIAPGVRIRSQGIRDVLLDPRDPTTIYVSAFNAGVFRSSPRLEGGEASFKPVFFLAGGADETTAAAIAITVHDGRTRLWAGNGVADPDLQGIYRADDADVPASELAFSTGGSVFNLPAWSSVTSGDPGASGFATYDFCGTQCGYDQVLAVPPGEPDTIFVGGIGGGLLGDPVVRSDDAGATFASFGFDAAPGTGLMHADVHAIAFDPDDPSIVFVASDGGILRNAGDLVDGSALCTSPTLGFAADDPEIAACLLFRKAVPDHFLFLNKGLATLQFYSVAADPRDPLGHLLGGTQDNATLGFDQGVSDQWSALLPVGDGVGGGFHPTRPDVVFAAANGLNFYTQEDAGPGTGTWVWTSGPILASQEASSVSPSFSGRQFFTIDPVRPDTQFTGAEHVWRTIDDGGDSVFLETHCTLFAIDRDFRDQCGDWAPLGPKLTDDSWGDREGGIVVAAARTRADSGTLWAATSAGRVFVSRNADAGDSSSVVFRRIDESNPAAPNRFVSAIVVDPQDPLRAWIGYSGFSAITPDRPGHVFEVTVDPDASASRWTPLDGDLGDLPVNHLVRDDRTGDLFAATDFGVLRRTASGHWANAGAGLPEVLTPFLEILPDDRLLLAATHGLGIWYLRLAPAP